MLTPESRGSVTIISHEPTAKPKIQHNYYSTQADLETAVAGVRIGMEIARQQALAPYTATHYQVPESDSESDVRQFIRRYTHSIFHGSGSCALGKVVDDQLRVTGLEGLRIADVSVMPRVGRGAPNASAIMIGEKAADLLCGLTAAEARPVEADPATVA